MTSLIPSDCLQFNPFATEQAKELCARESQGQYLLNTLENNDSGAPSNIVYELKSKRHNEYVSVVFNQTL